MTFDIKRMLVPEVFEHPVGHLELIETHISWVILTGEFAYKIKKPVNFGFLDFSTLDKRHLYCDQELQLNRRLAPEIYIEVVPITESQSSLLLSGDGEIIEYAVKMKQFPQSAQLDNMLASGDLGTGHMDAIATMVARFHQQTAVSEDSMEYGNNDMIYQPVGENFIQIKEQLHTGLYTDKLGTLELWCRSEFERLKPVFERRRHDGFIRECHGDMHLRNLVWLDGRALAFDCIDFSEKLRWIDVISEVAFLVMDLQVRNQTRLANRFLNTYLELTGDYDGLSVMPFYLCYRALVRAKVDALRLGQDHLSEAERKNICDEFESYLDLAITYTQQPTPKIIIMRGMSASGKSTVSQKLLDAIGAIRIRSDVERKRLFGVTPTTDASDDVDTGIYSKDASRLTYEKLIELTSTTIKAGYSVIVDAAFLKHEQREAFQNIAEQLKVPYIILEITAPADILRQRITQRKNDASDANLAVLEHQLSNWKHLDDEETNAVIRVDTSEPLDTAMLIDEISNK